MLISEFPISNRTKNVLIQNGFISEEDLSSKFLEDLKSIEGMGDKGVMEIREYLYGKFGIVLKHKPKDKKISNPKEARSVILHFLSHSKNIFWPKEMAAANKLLSFFDLKTLRSVVPNEKAYSLSYYLCQDGRKYIRTYLPSIKIVEQNLEENTEESIEQPLEVLEEVQLNLDLSVKKPKSLKNFLFK
jgi:hypothetical protein